jgi:hypothetical protein
MGGLLCSGTVAYYSPDYSIAVVFLGLLPTNEYTQHCIHICLVYKPSAFISNSDFHHKYNISLRTIKMPFKKVLNAF